MRIAPVTPLAAGPELRIASFNVENLFDTVDDPRLRDTVLTPAAYALKLHKLALAIRNELGAPDLVALQEVENRQVLDDLLRQPELAGLGYRAAILPGNDARGINVAVIHRGSVEITRMQQANATVTSRTPSGQVDTALLFSRPPLIVDATFNGPGDAVAGQQITLIVNHFKSKMGGPRYDPLREQQAKFVAGLVDARTAAHATAHVAVIGDLNANEHETSFQHLIKRTDGTTRLSSVTAGLAPGDRYSWGKRDLFDHILVTGGLQAALTGASILHFNTSASKGTSTKPGTAARSSDHDPIVASFRFPRRTTV